MTALRGADVSLIPEPGQTRESDGRRALWSGRGQALVIGPRPDAPGAAVTDQTGAWVMIRLAGPGAADAMARLTPVDLRPAAFPEGAVARTLVGHMNALIARAEGGFDILAFRSMAGTLAHDLRRAMEGVAARAAMTRL